ncbi:chromate transporter [Ralstonia solanacearum]|uniref:Chromate transporter n=1 Tax=Ralstonia solanacearum TaxID=305 RepID=A0AAW5ZQC5_RALSL|nr:chromate transporter [Ralstonia solanacearum]AYB52074.1 chromate transporter [Ralstonia solanacearum]AYB56630.1 chromate transporter [Ralstonia solanacearum]MBB6591645.1 chromate transporter [Ralstonia solanacearum]MBB6595868.1 chromate transporter [Ralstonia solanacearum]MDB0514401.1 chromate transporter [Ralstonia solanacearum]
MEGDAMSYLATLFDLFWHFVVLSFLAIGGASTTLPDMHRFLVDTRHYMTGEQLSAMYAISQAAPGPNVLFVELFGWQAAGLGGAVAAMLGICGPSCVIAGIVARVMHQAPDARWVTLIRRGLAPLTIGLLFSTGWVLARATDHSVGTVALTAATVLACTFTRVHPLILVAAGALVGALGWA